jgi:hypothetical protein
MCGHASEDRVKSGIEFGDTRGVCLGTLPCGAVSFFSWGLAPKHQHSCEARLYEEGLWRW